MKRTLHLFLALALSLGQQAAARTSAPGPSTPACASSASGAAPMPICPTATPAYTQLDAELTWRLGKDARRNVTLILQGANLLDEEIRIHTSYLKNVAPQMGRSFTLGLRGEF